MTALANIPVISTIVPQNGAPLPTHVANYGQGGYMTAASTSDMQAIPVSRRVVGMACLIVDAAGNATLYILQADLTTWKPYNLTAGSGAFSWQATTIDLTGKTTYNMSLAEALSLVTFGGTLSGDCVVTYPQVPFATDVANFTTGTGTLTLTTRTGNSVLLARNMTQQIWCNGTEVRTGVTDFSGAFMPANVTGVTQPAGTNNKTLATTEFVQTAVSAINTGVTSFNGRTGNVVLSNSDVTNILNTVGVDGGSF